MSEKGPSRYLPSDRSYGRESTSPKLGLVVNSVGSAEDRLTGRIEGKPLRNDRATFGHLAEEISTRCRRESQPIAALSPGVNVPAPAVPNQPSWPVPLSRNGRHDDERTKGHLGTLPPGSTLREIGNLPGPKERPSRTLSLSSSCRLVSLYREDDVQRGKRSSPGSRMRQDQH